MMKLFFFFSLNYSNQEMDLVATVLTYLFTRHFRLTLHFCVRRISPLLGFNVPGRLLLFVTVLWLGHAIEFLWTVTCPEIWLCNHQFLVRQYILYTKLCTFIALWTYWIDSVLDYDTVWAKFIPRFQMPVLSFWPLLTFKPQLKNRLFK